MSDELESQDLGPQQLRRLNAIQSFLAQGMEEVVNLGNKEKWVWEEKRYTKRWIFYIENTHNFDSVAIRFSSYYI